MTDLSIIQSCYCFSCPYSVNNQCEDNNLAQVCPIITKFAIGGMDNRTSQADRDFVQNLITPLQPEKEKEKKRTYHHQQLESSHKPGPRPRKINYSWLRKKIDIPEISEQEREKQDRGAAQIKAHNDSLTIEQKWREMNDPRWDVNTIYHVKNPAGKKRRN